MALQDRCSKCNLPLEEQERQIIGLGATCEKNCYTSYIEDVVTLKNKELSGDIQFNWLAVMANPLHALTKTINEVHKEGVFSLLETTLDRLSTALASHAPNEILPWQIVLDCFSIARNNSSIELTNSIHQSLRELGFDKFVSLASGDFCLGNGILDFDGKVITLDASVRRSASEVFNNLNKTFPGTLSRPNTNLWKFHIKHAQIVLDTFLIRWPLAENRKVTPAFYEALELSKNLPPEPPKPLPYTINVCTDREVRIRKKDNNGSYIWSYHTSNRLYNLLIEAGARYQRQMTTDDTQVYMVPEDKLETIETIIQTLFEEQETPQPKATHSKSSYKSYYKKR